MFLNGKYNYLKNASSDSIDFILLKKTRWVKELSLIPLPVSWKHRNISLKKVLNYSILSLFTKFNPFLFQLRQNENFWVLEYETGFWEFRLSTLETFGIWLTFTTFIKLFKLGFDEFFLYFWILIFALNAE
jgi:hypothetical protein